MMCTAAKLLVRSLLLFLGWLFALAQLAHSLLVAQQTMRKTSRWSAG